MEDWFELLFFVGLIAISLTVRVRKTMKDSVAPEANTADSNSQTEDLFSEDDTTDYFSYETVEENSYTSQSTPWTRPDENVRPKTKRNVAQETASSEGLECEEVSFDLRQAVIAQTILNNDYIADMK